MVEDIKVKVLELLNKYEAKLIVFGYYKKHFGNIVLEIEHNGDIMKFVTDRGDIYCNNTLLCDYEYLRTEKKTTPIKLLELVEEKLEV